MRTSGPSKTSYGGHARRPAPGRPGYRRVVLLRGDPRPVQLSSKNHVDVPIEIGKETVHFLLSHPTPPVFDGPEDRNGTRNHDEIRFWADYVGPGAERGSYIYDDQGNTGGLEPGSLFVIAGDQNSDPFDGDSIPGSAQLLLEHPRINAKTTPTSEGGVDWSAAQPGNETHVGDPAQDTADFSEPPSDREPACRLRAAQQEPPDPGHRGLLARR